MQKHIFFTNRKQFYKDLVICLMIVALPLLFYFYRLVPSIPIWETKYFTLNSQGHQNAQIFIWILLIKILAIGILSIWFLTCQHWWRNAILVPLIIELFKLFSYIDTDNRFFDVNDYFKSLPYTLIIISLIIYVGNKLGYYNKSLNLNQKLTQEIDVLFCELNDSNTKAFLDAKTKYEKLIENKKHITKEQYLESLLEIRNSITILND